MLLLITFVAQQARVYLQGFLIYFLFMKNNLPLSNLSSLSKLFKVLSPGYDPFKDYLKWKFYATILLTFCNKQYLATVTASPVGKHFMLRLQHYGYRPHLNIMSSNDIVQMDFN